MHSCRRAKQTEALPGEIAKVLEEARDQRRRPQTCHCITKLPVFSLLLLAHCFLSVSQLLLLTLGFIRLEEERTHGTPGAGHCGSMVSQKRSGSQAPGLAHQHCCRGHGAASSAIPQVGKSPLNQSRRRGRLRTPSSPCRPFLCFLASFGFIFGRDRLSTLSVLHLLL